MEELHYSPEGKLHTLGPSTYKIPAFGSIPIEFRVSLLRDCPNKKAIYASKVLRLWVCYCLLSRGWEVTVGDPPGRSARDSSYRRKRIDTSSGKAAELRNNRIVPRTHSELLTEAGSCWEPQRDSLTKSHGSNSDLCSVCSHASWSLILRDDFIDPASPCSYKNQHTHCRGVGHLPIHHHPL